MTSVVTALVLSFFITLVLTPLVRAWALRSGVVDQPGGRRVHQRITPRLGGVSVIFGFFTPLAFFTILRTGAMQGFLAQEQLVLGLVFGSAIVGVVGVVDDVRGLGPWPKLLAQATAAITAYAFGYRIDAVDLPLIGVVDFGIFGLPCTVFWFLAITNAINLIDGLDGLAAGISFFAAAFTFVTGLVNQSHVVVLLSASLGGALLGFLRYNFNPATIFLGDAGSMFLGFVLAATSIAGATTKASAAIAILAPVIALGVPIMDTMLAMLRRVVTRQPIFGADRGHIHHRLLDLGITHRRVVLSLYLCSILLAAAALGITFGRSWQYGCALAIAGTVLMFLVRAANALNRAQRPLTSAAEKREAIEALRSRVRRSLSEFASCDSQDSIERCLHSLAADKRLFARVSFDSAQPGTNSNPTTDDVEIAYAFCHDGASARLTIRLNRSLAPVAPQAQIELQRVADACERAFRSAAAPRVTPELLVAK